MRKEWCLYLVVIAVGLGSLFFLSRKKESLKEEVVELVQLTDFEKRRGVSTPARSVRIVDVRLSEEEKGIMRSDSILEKVKLLSHLKREDLKALAEEILAVEDPRLFSKEASLLYRPLIRLMIELEPEWFLEKVTERWKAGSEFPLEKMQTDLAFSFFLKADRERALQWYEEGMSERPHRYFEKYSLRDVAIAELLKCDPLRAVRIFNSAMYPELSGVSGPWLLARFENLQQVRSVMEVLPGIEEWGRRNTLKISVFSETYRLGGKEALRDLVESEGGEKSGGFGGYEMIRRIKRAFQSEHGMGEVFELTREASEEVKVDVAVSVLRRWAYDDRVSAQQFIMKLPEGPVRQSAMNYLIGCISHDDPEAARDLLPLIKNEEERAILDREIKEKGK